jgi:hypothetical protein
MAEYLRAEMMIHTVYAIAHEIAFLALLISRSDGEKDIAYPK